MRELKGDQSGVRSANERGRQILVHPRGQMKKPSVKPTEHECPACNGTGFPKVMQPVQPGRKIYPVQCNTCSGKGRITEAVN